MIDLTNLPKPDYTSDDGSVVLYRGDCMDVLPKLPDGCVDACITDPPYGIGVGSAFVRKGGSQIDTGTGTFNDAPTWEWLSHTSPMRPGANVAVFHKRGDVPPENIMWWHRFYLIKKNPPCTPRPVFQSGVEECSIGTVPGGKRCWNGGGSTPNYLMVSVSESRDGTFEHPSPKPLRAIVKLLDCLSDHAQTILDPFMGSGTTGVACVKTGRKFIGIELSEQYFDIAVKRIEDAFADQGLFTGKVRGEKQMKIGGDA